MIETINGCTLPCGSFLTLACDHLLLSGVQGIPEFLGPSNRSHLKDLLEILSSLAFLPSPLHRLCKYDSRGYLTHFTSDYCCFGQVDMESVVQGACCSHSSGSGPQALLLSFLVAFLVLVLLLIIPAWPIKRQCLVFSSLFCVPWLALHILLELEGLLCSAISLLVNFPYL